MKILVTLPKGEIKDSFFDSRAIDRLNLIGDVIYNETEKDFTKEELREILRDIDVVVTGWGTALIDKSMILDTPLKMICHTGGSVGLVIDMDVYETDVVIISGNEYYAESVAEGVLAYMLFMLRKMDWFSSELKKGIWLDGNAAKNEGLLDQTVGLISLGKISRYMIEMSKFFRIKFKVFSTRPNLKLAEEMGFTYASLEEIFKTCKIVSVHTAKNPQTYHMINKEHFKLLQDDSIFINTSRGSVINEEDLIEDLKKNRFRALLDVYDIEPLPQGSPLLTFSNVTLFPHQAGPTFDRRAQITNFLIDDVQNYLKGMSVKNEITYDVAISMTK